MKKPPVKFFFFFLLMVISLFFFAFNVAAERPPFKIYTTEEGLAHDSVNKIVRDSRGFLWFCTAEGLSRFDGSRFTNFTQDQGLPHRNINDFLETRDGTYLIATSLGLTVFNPNGKAYRWNLLESRLEKNSDELPMFQTFAPEGKRQRKTILSLTQDRNGTIWAGSAFGLFRAEKVGDEWRFEEVEVEKDIKVGYLVLLPDSQGDLLIASDYGLYRYSTDGKFEKFDKFGAHSLIEDRDGRIWAGAGGDQIGLRVFERENENIKLSKIYTKKKDGLAEDSFQSALRQTSDGRIFIGIYRGLCEFLPEAKENEPKFRTLDTEKITALAEDAGGNLWLGTELKGAWKLPRHGFSNFGEKDGILPTDDLRSIFTNCTGQNAVNLYLSTSQNLDDIYFRATFDLPQKLLNEVAA